MESDKDLVAVELEPEKKGLVLKHREYTVTSTVSICTQMKHFKNMKSKGLSLIHI